MIPQIIYLSLLLISLLIQAYEHGKPKQGKHNFWYNLISVPMIVCMVKNVITFSYVGNHKRK